VKSLAPHRPGKIGERILAPMRDQDADRPKAVKSKSGAELHQQDDNAIARASAEVLCWDVLAKEQRVKAHVKHGWVTISGVVDWQYQKNNAAADVRKLPGVVRVTNEIVVRSVVAPPSSKRRLPR
jgi:osmotically-inducible protein OsmY